jgi:riboflavin kinase/FMN adenylyltransferase
LKVIEIHHPHSFKIEDFPRHVIALGYFDGVHLGHRAVLATAKKIAEINKRAFSIMIFDPHPSIVLNKGIKQYRQLAPLTEKIKLLETFNPDFLFITKFSNDFASLSPQEFVDQYLVGLNVVHVVAGFDYKFGKYGEGNMRNIIDYSKGRFGHTAVVEQKLLDGKISSTRIRQFLKNGEMLDVKKLLGRFYTIKGVVVHGEKRGRKIGFPTANIEPTEEFDLPTVGVYAVRILVKGKWHTGVCNVGYKPTFHDNPFEQPVIEVHIIDFNEDIYDETVVIEWHRHIRSEKRFNGIEELVAQIHSDKEETIEFFR